LQGRQLFRVRHPGDENPRWENDRCSYHGSGQRTPPDFIHTGDQEGPWLIHFIFVKERVILKTLHSHLTDM
jgi:hypothetical protein